MLRLLLASELIHSSYAIKNTDASRNRYFPSFFVPVFTVAGINTSLPGC